MRRLQPAAPKIVFLRQFHGKRVDKIWRRTITMIIETNPKFNQSGAFTLEGNGLGGLAPAELTKNRFYTRLQSLPAVLSSKTESTPKQGEWR